MTYAAHWVPGKVTMPSSQSSTCERSRPGSPLLVLVMCATFSYSRSGWLCLQVLRSGLLQKQHALGITQRQLTHHDMWMVRISGSSLVPPRISELVLLKKGTSKKYAGIMPCREQTLPEFSSVLRLNL